MKKNILWASGGVAVLSIGLIALPSPSATIQEQDDSSPTVRVEQLPQVHRLRRIQINGDRVVQDEDRVLQQSQGVLTGTLSDPETTLISVFDGEEGPSWLGVETHEVTPENAKELKLPAERGVVVAGVTEDSPAARAGLKEKDVITEVNGQRVEGAAQFRRIIHEIPAGRTAQLTVWRDGRAQTVGATLGKAEERHNAWMGATPGAFAFRMPDVQTIPDMPSIDLGDGMAAVLPGGRPRLGIDAEDIGGQLGSFFGAPDGEGILVRSVNSGSAAEKAGLKAGDVITSFNGERVRSLGDLRQKLAAQNEAKIAKIGVLRNKSEVTLSVELPARTPQVHKLMQRTNI
jgi:serine protease Do